MSTSEQPARTDRRDQNDQGVRARTDALVEALRVFGGAYAELTRRFAEHLDLHATDARALTEILIAEDQGRPLTPGRLGERIGLSSGATTNLCHRLEAAGWVHRVRDPGDRRSVTLRSSGGIESPAGEFFAPFDRTMTALVADHDPAVVDAAVALLQRLDRDLATLLGTPVPTSRPHGGDPGSAATGVRSSPRGPR